SLQPHLPSSIFPPLSLLLAPRSYYHVVALRREEEHGSSEQLSGQHHLLPALPRLRGVLHLVSGGARPLVRPREVGQPLHRSDQAHARSHPVAPGQCPRGSARLLVLRPPP